MAILDQIQNDEKAVSVQEVLDDLELKVMELIGHIGELIQGTFGQYGPHNAIHFTDQSQCFSKNLPFHEAGDLVSSPNAHLITDTAHCP